MLLPILPRGGASGSCRTDGTAVGLLPGKVNGWLASALSGRCVSTGTRVVLHLSRQFLVGWLIARGFPARQTVQGWLVATLAGGVVLWAPPAVAAPPASGQQLPPSDSRPYPPPKIRRLPLVNSEVRVARAESQFLTYEQVRQLEKPSLAAPTDWSSDCQPCKVCFPQAPKPLDLAGHQVEIGVTGSLWFDGLHDFQAMGMDSDDPDTIPREFIPALIPVTGIATEQDNRTGFSPNQTNFESWLQAPTELGQLRLYTKLNLAKYATSNDFQVYKAYAEWGWLKAGLDYTLFLNQSAAPDNLDYEGPNAIPYVRPPNISLKIPLEAFALPTDHFVVLGMETSPADLTVPYQNSGRNFRLRPQYTVVFNDVELGADLKYDCDTASGDPRCYSTDDQLPAFISKWVYQPDWAHIELAGLYRQIRAVGIHNYHSTVNGWGVALSGKIDTWGSDSIILAGQTGQALGAYSQDTAGLGLDAAPISSGNTPLKAIGAIGAWAAYEHWWTNVLRSTVTYGYLALDSGFAQTTNKQGTYLHTHYASANIIWSPIPSVDVGMAYLFGIRRITAESYENLKQSGQPPPFYREANDHRLQVTIRWNFGYESPKIK